MFQTIMRWVAMLALGLVALLTLGLAVAMPLAFPSQAEKSREYYQHFREAAMFVHDYAVKNGHLPDIGSQPIPGIPEDYRILYITERCLNDSFETRRDDQFILAFSRRDGEECFAYPSGRTTLRTSASAYLFEGYGLGWASYWIIGLGAAWAAWTLGQRQTRKIE